jgi:predicted membrane-bound mannosyltransferase
MTHSFRSHFKKYRTYYSLCVILLVAFFIRSYNFSDLLVFQSDQSRDFLIIQEVLRGDITDLPLQGPQARGSTLHLGPVFYYFQYISASLFGGTIESLAYPDLLFSVLGVLLLFFVLRAIVSLEVSLAVTLLAAISYFLVSFSRFAWNPNSLPFFTLLLALSVVTFYKNPRYRVPSVITAAVSTGIVLQLHFVVALAIILTISSWLIIYRPLSFRLVALACSLILVIQTPTIVQEIKSSGSVQGAFIETVKQKHSKENKHSLLERGFRSGQSLIGNVLLVTTGMEYTQLVLTRGWNIQCDADCQSELPKGFFAGVIFVSLFLGYLQALRRKTCLQQRELLVFFGIWFFCYFLVTTLVAYQISTRFYLGLVPVIFLAIALLLEQLKEKRRYLLATAVIMGMLLGNAFTGYVYIRELERSQHSNAETKRDLIFGTEEKVTLGQLRSLARQVTEEVPTNAAVFITGESRYVRSLYSILSYEQNFSNLCYVKGDQSGVVNAYQVEVNKNKTQANYSGTLKISIEPPKERADSTNSSDNCFQNN